MGFISVFVTDDEPSGLIDAINEGCSGGSSGAARFVLLVAGFLALWFVSEVGGVNVLTLFRVFGRERGPTLGAKTVAGTFRPPAGSFVLVCGAALLPLPVWAGCPFLGMF